MGHGKTECDASGVPSIQTMPLNTALITASECGINTIASAISDMQTISTLSPTIVHELIERKEYYSSEQVHKKYKKDLGQILFLEKEFANLPRSIQVTLPMEK
jgi:hypothetical protein